MLYAKDSSPIGSVLHRPMDPVMEAQPANGVNGGSTPEAEPRTRPPRFMALSLLMVMVWTTAGFGLLLALAAFGLQCDESCVSPPRSGTEWYQRPDAGEWTQQLVLAFLGFVGVVAATVFIITRRRLVVGIATLVASAVCYAVWAQLLSESFWL